jgi:predicted O-methyltransferase YrrM
MARASKSLPPQAVIVEIGSFLGSTAVLLAGARKLCGSGRVHCIDPFDASGDSFSVPTYERMRDRLDRPLRAAFDENLRRTGLGDWVEVHQGTEADVFRSWRAPVDLLLLDGDQTYAGVTEAYRRWVPHLKLGGTLAVGNSLSDSENHDGSRRLVSELIHPPQYDGIRLVDRTTFAIKRA